MSIPITRKLNDTGIAEKYHFIFQNVKRKLFVFNHISMAIYSIINCLIVLIVISVLRLK